MIYFEKKGIKEFKTLPPIMQNRIKISLQKLPTGDIKPLEGYHSVFRLPCGDGDYRIIYEKRKTHIYIIRIGHRKDIYR